MDTPLADDTTAALRPLARQFPTLDAALGEVARLSAELALPMGSVHVISDIHGEDGKLRHVVNNASGMLRPQISRLFAERLTQEQIAQLTSLVFYPRETLAMLEPTLRDPARRAAFCRQALGDLFYLISVLARRYTQRRAAESFPAEYRDLFAELLREPTGERGPQYHDAMVEPLVRHERALHVIRLAVRVVRNLAVDELVIAGDCWDRGPRGDRVVDHLMKQPRLSFVWGNHDAAWLGACLGNRALVAHVLRISLRYGRLEQLEEGYGIPLEPLERLARSVYGDDPATSFVPKLGTRGREPLLLARMQKAAAVMQFKLEGAMIARNPHWGLEHRRLLGGIDLAAKTIRIDGAAYALRDARWPTLDTSDPEALTAEEAACLEETRSAFVASRKLWDHMRFLLTRGRMALVRDDHLIFHGCLAVDAGGNFLPFAVDGVERTGKALFDAIDGVLCRVLDRATLGLPGDDARAEADADLMWYLWCGPRSPLFGKDKIATLEIDFVEDKHVKEETKNPYFSLIHDAGFCDRILAEFGVDPKRGMVVNGHVPVKIEKGESPMKRSGKAITIDGAFSEAYGDRGYTLVLEPTRTILAEHHHFESAEAAVREGKDIIPSISVIRTNEPARKTADTQRGAEIRAAISWLEKLVAAYRSGALRAV